MFQLVVFVSSPMVMLFHPVSVSSGATVEVSGKILGS